MTETLTTAALASGLSWSSGIRLYLALFVAGWFSRMEWITLPSALQVLASPWVMAATGALLVVEFLADKIPGFDSVLDAVHTFIRIPAGAILAAAALGQMDPAWTAIAALAGGSLAASAHFTKAGARVLINTSPEPLSNWAASIGEDATAVGVLWATFFHPWLLFTFLLAFLLLATWLLPRLWRGMRWLAARLSI